MEADRLQSEIDALEAKLKAKKEHLSNLQRSCSHDWGQTEYVPIYHEAYYIRSDKERGIEMGVDSLPGCHVPAETIKRWKRTCLLCGMYQTTQNTKKVYSSSSTPGCSCEQEVPNFGD